jgi:2-dehydrotetronate isomerase
MPKFSANLGFLWPDLPLLERVDAAAAAGFRAIELHSPDDIAPEVMRTARLRHGLALLGINTPRGGSPGDFGLAAVPGRVDEFRHGFRLAADYARRSGAAAIHVMAGKVTGDQRAEAERTFLANLGWAAAEAPETTLLLEPINARDRPGYFYATIPEAAALMDRLAAPNIGIMFDAYHVGMGGADVLETLRAFLPRIRHVQIAAVPSRAEPDEGDLAYQPFLTSLDALGYSGWVGCEYAPRASTTEGLKWLTALGFAL